VCAPIRSNRDFGVGSSFIPAIDEFTFHMSKLTNATLFNTKI